MNEALTRLEDMGGSLGIQLTRPAAWRANRPAWPIEMLVPFNHACPHRSDGIPRLQQRSLDADGAYTIAQMFERGHDANIYTNYISYLDIQCYIEIDHPASK